MMRKNITIVYHILGSIGFLSIPILFSPDFSSDLHFLKIKGFQEDLIFHFLLLLFFYLNYTYFIPALYFKSKKILYTLLIATSFVAVISLPEIIIPHHGRIMSNRDEMRMDHPMDRIDFEEDHFDEFENFDRPHHREREHRGPKRDFKVFMFLKSVFQFILVMIIGLMIQINRRFKNLEKSKIATELSYLKSQINPHFLFNTLNSIYSLAIVGSNHTADAVVKLSNMMRYVLNDANKDWVSLEQEISYISNYIELQKLRFANSVKIDFNVDGELSGKVIAPLIIIPFIENAFKYGVNAEQNSSIIIDINSKSKMLEVRIWNKKVDFNESDSESTGIGIENTKNRLRLLYPNKHVLSIDDNSDYFEVILIFNFI